MATHSMSARMAPTPTEEKVSPLQCWLCIDEAVESLLTMSFAFCQADKGNEQSDAPQELWCAPVRVDWDALKMPSE